MSEVLIYQSNSNQIEVSVQFDGETVWLNQEQLTALFERDRTVIGRHIKNIFKEGELREEAVCADLAHITQHGTISTFQHLMVIIPDIWLIHILF